MNFRFCLININVDVNGNINGKTDSHDVLHFSHFCAEFFKFDKKGVSRNVLILLNFKVEIPTIDQIVRYD